MKNDGIRMVGGILGGFYIEILMETSFLLPPIPLIYFSHEVMGNDKHLRFDPAINLVNI